MYFELGEMGCAWWLGVCSWGGCGCRAGIYMQRRDAEVKGPRVLNLVLGLKNEDLKMITGQTSFSPNLTTAFYSAVWQGHLTTPVAGHFPRTICPSDRSFKVTDCPSKLPKWHHLFSCHFGISNSLHFCRTLNWTHKGYIKA